MPLPSPTVVVDGIVFPEGPRWHDGALWFSDMHAHRVLRAEADGSLTVVADLDLMPSGLGWLPDGSLLVTTMHDRRILRIDGDGAVSVHADLRHLPSSYVNDMVVDEQGRAYVGILQPRANTPEELDGRTSKVRDELALVLPDGSARIVADDLIGPNGVVITPDGTGLILAEARGRRLTAFDIADDGSLTNRRLFADVDPHLPDGICLDAAGGIWFGSPITSTFVRVLDGGEQTHAFPTEGGRWAVACALGGADRRTLYLCTSLTELENIHRVNAQEPGYRSTAAGRIEALTVEHPGAGLP